MSVFRYGNRAITAKNLQIGDIVEVSFLKIIEIRGCCLVNVYWRGYRDKNDKNISQI